MSQVIQLWKKISLKLFFPEERRLLVWTLVGPILLICSSLVLLSAHAPLQTLLLIMGSFLLLTFFFAPAKIAKFAFVGVALFSIYCLKVKPGSFSFLEVLWTIQYLSSLFIAQKMIFATREYMSSNAESLRAIESDKGLWESRFDTLHEKIESDREVWEGEIEAAKHEASEKVAYAESLRRLVDTAHATIRQLETRPVGQENNLQEENAQAEFDRLAILQHERESLLSTVDSMRLLKEKDEKITELNMLIDLEKENDSTELLLEKDEKIAELEMSIELKKEDNSSELLLEKDEKIAELEMLVEIAKEDDSSELLLENEEKIKELERIVEGRAEYESVLVDGKEIDSDGVMRILTELNETREQNYQLEILLSDAKDKYEDMQNAVDSRRSRNQELLKTNSEKPITLQALAKKAKR